MADTIVLVRHGETEWSLSGQHTSRTDLPLLEEGQKRAKVVGGELAGRSFALVVSSPYRRARETAELAGFAEPEIWDDLHEWAYGEYEGLTTPEIREQNPEWNLWTDGCPGGESPAQIAARADGVLARLREADGDALVFAHGHILRVTAARWMEMDVTAGARLALSAGAVSELGYERETQVIRRWNA
ncbi:MAG TPA: histidine phosphatase family protein [Solirubrobacteraceae bacterium]|jgi:probable phosphoglycerate mutase